MKFVAISDTHGLHAQLELPLADVLIHAGDVSRMGTLNQVLDFLEWYAALPHPYKVFIAGNHDFYFERQNAAEIIPPNLIYLNDSEVVIEGIKIWGSPVQPAFHNWAFNRERGEELRKHWNLIPPDTDILITHGPPFGVLDQTVGGEMVGCHDLLDKVLKIKPKYCIFGHIHEAYGQLTREEVHFINASALNFRYQVVNAPVVFEW